MAAPLYRVCGRNIYRNHLLYGAAGLSVTFGLASVNMIGNRDPPQGPRPTRPEAQAGRQRAAAMEGVIRETQQKPVRQRVEDAFDGAVNTHEIGFPSSKR